MPPLRQGTPRADPGPFTRTGATSRENALEPLPGSMVVLMALVAVFMTMVAVIVLVAVVVMVMVVIMTTAAGRIMPMRMMVLVVVVGMGMTMAVIMAMVVMVMVVMAVMAVVVATGIAMIVVMDFGLGLERPLGLAHRAALAANQLGQRGIVLDIDRIGRDLRRDMAAPEVPGEARQPQRVLGRDRDQLLRRSLDQHQPAILELDRVAVVQRGRLVEVEQNLLPAIALERGMARVAAMMVEGEGLDDPVLLDRGLADDGDGALHGETRGVMDKRRSTDRGSITSTTGAGPRQAPALRPPGPGFTEPPLSRINNHGPANTDPVRSPYQ